MKTIMLELYEYAVNQELAEADRQGSPITRAEAEQRVKEFFEKELEDLNA